MMVNASMVFGLDQDHPDVFDNTLDWLVRNRVETMTAHILTPYPGTRLFARLQAEGRIVDYDWSLYNTSHVVFRPQYMTAQQLLDGYLGIYRRFYSLPCIFQRQPQHPRQHKAYWLFNLAYRKYGWITAALAGMGLMNLTGRMARRLSYGID